MAKTTKRTRGKGRSVLERVAEGADRILLDIIKNGQVMQDANGRLSRRTPSAAMMSMIYRRLKSLKNQRPLSNPAQALADEAERRGLRLPDDRPIGQIGPRGR